MPSDREREHDHVLPDGTTVRIRPIRTDDDQRLLEMWARTSAESRRARFMGSFQLDERNVGRFTHLDPQRQLALVAALGRDDGERIVGVARFERDPDAAERAEFAALVEDAHQGRGIGTALLRHVARTAHAEGVRVLSGDVLSSNSRMLNTIREIGLEHSSHREAEAWEVVRTDLDLADTERFLRVVAADERDAARAALRRFLQPARIAVVGASRDRHTIGGMVFAHLVASGYSGVAYPVNAAAEHVQGVAAYPRLSDTPQVPDLVLVCVPAAAVNDVVEEAGELGVRAVCIVSAGFAESSEQGAQRQRELMERARGHGLRVIGPNCMGVLNGASGVRMNATFSPVLPRPGRLAFSSQSGALGLAVLEHMERLGLGISTFVSVGNKADISGNDLLLYWEEDAETDIILLYLESFGNPRKFARLARRISRHKPIVAVKSGRTAAGVRAASSHTAAISSGDVAVDALFRQTGVIRTDTLQELFDVASLLSSQPLPRGDSVAIVTNAGGPGILAADACESNGLSVPRLSERTREQLRELLPDEAGIDNPVDMIASATPDGYARAVEILGGADEVDAVFVIFIPAGVGDVDEVASALAEARARVPVDTPIMAVFMSSGSMARPERAGGALTAARIPSFAFPEDAARALGRVADHARWLARPVGGVVEPTGIDRAGARAVVDAALMATVGAHGQRLVGKAHSAELAAEHPDDTRQVDDPVWLGAAEAAQILLAYGVPLARARVVRNSEQGAAAQRELGGPVALKVDAPIHKSDVGGVRLDLTAPQEVADAITDVDAALRDAGLAEHTQRFLVQEMVTGGVEMVVGVSHDPSFGPVVMAGLGGRLVELVRDVSVRVTPLTDVDVADMIASLRMRPLLAGYRGTPPADVTALEDLLHRVNAMVEDLPEIVELDLNPVFVRPEGQGVVAVDVRMRLRAPSGLAGPARK